ncbi:MAG TPA: hypothetical protein DIW17_08990 [Clostridiales bacterium]|jgi:endoglucanase|nr:hypothetical protein [Clostridiales bacterium]
MKKHITLLLLILLLPCFSCAEPSETDIIDEDENKTPVILNVPFSKGVNLSNWFLADREDDIYKQKYTKKDFEDIKSLGIDVIRLPIRFYKIAGNAPDYLLNQSFFDKLDYALDLAEQTGINIILDNHSYFGSNPFPAQYGEEQLTKIWQQVALHCKERSDLVYYELYNEPDGNYMRNNWGEMQGRLIDAIRKIDTRHTIIVGGYDANSPGTLKDLPVYDDDNLIYTFHFYEPFLFTHQASDWTLLENVSDIPFPYQSDKMPECPPELIGTGEWGDRLFIDYPTKGTVAAVKNSIDQAVSFSKSKNVPVFCGEFGVHMYGVDNDQRCFWYKTVYDYFEANDIPWTMWDYHNSFGLFKEGGSYRFEYDLNVPLLEALNLNIPQSYISGEKPSIVFYDDNIAHGMKDASWGGGEINFEDTTSPSEGEKSIFWKVGSEWSAIVFEIWPTINIEEQFTAGQALNFDIKCSSQVNMQIRFVEYQDDSQPWRNTFLLTDDMVANDGSWTSISIPLDSFEETGAWDDIYYEPQDLFNWKYINKLEFAIEGNEDMIDAEIGIDNVTIKKSE